jgi:hypothetical protein
MVRAICPDHGGETEGSDPFLIALRGNARDLVLPPDSDEFIFPALRIGYTFGAL